MTTPDSVSLYQSHIEELCRRYEGGLETTGYAAVLVAAGQPHNFFLDDQTLPFRPAPDFAQWGPLREHPGSALLYEQGKAPELLVYAPTDFWHCLPPVADDFSAAGVSVSLLKSPAEIRQRLNQIAGPVAFLGEAIQPEDSFGLHAINPEQLVKWLHESRTVKTAWEVECMRQASLIGVKGHRAAEACFMNGGSEYEIQAAFRAACETTDNEMPYPAIVALNEHAATLHYQRLDRQRCNNLSLLIDAGHAVHGYASDITRTYSDDACFGALVEAMHELQRYLCSRTLAGTDYRELHKAAHLGIAELLHEAEILSLSPEATVESGISRVFFPHGLGHYLGLQVHDVGALYTRRSSTEASAPGEDPHLRLTRVLQAGNVLTIEPGLYFIAPLLEELQSRPEARHIDWARVDQLRPFGGIRIEDNIHVTADGNENLTRAAFAAGHAPSEC